MKNTRAQIFLYDTTLRDGSQRKGISYSLNDKLRIARLLDEFGINYIEGGWPGSNPKDREFFQKARELGLKNAKITAFGSTRRAKNSAAEDANLLALIEAETEVVTLVGKSWDLHVTEVLSTSLEENLSMISESVAFLKSHNREVIYDAEHFFDGYRANPEYALKTLQAATSAGADYLVLCDTNGGSLPGWIHSTIKEVQQIIKVPLGIHAHNDCELAVANSLAAVDAGCTQIQGTINGYGERCGNANLVSIVPNLVLKLGFECTAAAELARLQQLSRTVSEIANISPDEHAPYVGKAAFAHKGGIHVAAVEKIPESYEHVPPEVVGNSREVVISELSGRGNIRMRAAGCGLNINIDEAAILSKVKDLEAAGLTFDDADGSFELLLRRSVPEYKSPFSVTEYMVVAEKRNGSALTVEAVVKVEVNGVTQHTACEGSGPVHALDGALRKALLSDYPILGSVRLSDYKVRILDPDKATAATTRVTINAAANTEWWSTVGCSHNIVDASVQALAESYELYILRQTK